MRCRAHDHGPRTTDEHQGDTARASKAWSPRAAVGTGRAWRRPSEHGDQRPYLNLIVASSRRGCQPAGANALLAASSQVDPDSALGEPELAPIAGRPRSTPP